MLKHTGIAQRRYTQNDEASSDLIIKAVPSNINYFNRYHCRSHGNNFWRLSFTSHHFVHAGVKITRKRSLFRCLQVHAVVFFSFKSAFGVMMTSQKHVMVAE